MQLDVRTLLVAVALATVFCAAARFLLWRMHPAVPGLARWAWAGLLGAAALLLIVLRDVLSDALALSAAQLAVILGFALGWDGYRRFAGRRPLPWWLFAGVAAAVIVATAMTDIQHSLMLRTLVNALAIGVLSVLTARELLRDGGLGLVAMRATGWIYGANALFFLARSGHIVATGAPVDPWGAQSFASITLLWWLCMTTAITLGMVLMTGEHLQAALDRQASSDPLTGALNRRAFAMMADKVVARARRSGQPLSVLMIDLDHFKRINDTLGHAAGDEALRLFVAIAKRLLRGEDVFCRHGGEEFVALLPATSAERALAAAERLRSSYAEEAAAALLEPGHPMRPMLTVSIGVGEMRPGEDVDALLARADAALYVAKAQGRNRCEPAQPQQAA